MGMGKRTGSAHAIALVAALSLAAFVFVACGDSGNERDKKQCQVCDPLVHGHCLEECIEFCPAGEDCTSRCEAQCDECKRDLRCVACSVDCTGTHFRCSPPGEVVTCEDGQF